MSRRVNFASFRSSFVFVFSFLQAGTMVVANEGAIIGLSKENTFRDLRYLGLFSTSAFPRQNRSFPSPTNCPLTVTGPAGCRPMHEAVAVEYWSRTPANILYSRRLRVAGCATVPKVPKPRIVRVSARGSSSIYHRGAPSSLNRADLVRACIPVVYGVFDRLLFQSVP